MSKIPYAEALGERDPLRVLTKTPRKLMRLLDDLSDKEIEARPAPGKWNLRETVAHMADCEIAWAWRLRVVQAEKKPTLTPFDQDAWAKSYEKYSLAEALGCFKSLRKWNVALIDSFTEKDKQKVALHPEHGKLTLWNLVEIMGGHDLHHLRALDK